MKVARRSKTALLMLMALGFTSCGQGTQTGSSEFVKLQGAGASFPAPLYTKWVRTFSGAHNVQIDYQSVGSGSGVKSFIEDGGLWRQRCRHKA